MAFEGSDVLEIAERVNARLAREQWNTAALDTKPAEAELETAAANDPLLLAILADGWSRLGDPRHALMLARKALTLDPSRAARLRCAGVLPAVDHHRAVDDHRADAPPDTGAGRHRSSGR